MRFSDETSTALFTDLYELTMAQAYWQKGMDGPATFSLTFRECPPNRGYLVLGGVSEALDYLETFRFSGDDVDYLRSTGKFDLPFLDHLSSVGFTGSVRAMPDGAVFFANEPVLEVTAPILQAQMLETYLLNRVNLHTLLATKASRVVHAARGKTLVDFAARRTQGVDAANVMARVSYMAGFAGTSNVMSGKLYGIPTFGTMAHSFVEAMESEEESFRAYAGSFPDSSTFLVDTYDTVAGVRKAISVAREMQRRGHSLRAVRLDSGNVLELSVRARALLDEAGLERVQVFVTGGMDEFQVEALLERGAPIDGFGIGAKVGVSADAPLTDCIYKLVEYQGRPTLKLSAGKQTLPCPKQVFRVRDDRGQYREDVICLAGEEPPDGGPQALLEDVMMRGRRVSQPQSLQVLRERFKEEFAGLPEQHKRLHSPAEYRVSISPALEALNWETTATFQRRESGGR